MPRLLVPLLVVCASAFVPASTAADLREVVQRGTLKVLVASDEQPELFSFKAAGEPGFERELIEGFGRLHRVKVDIVPVANFDEIIAMLNHGEGDLITGITDTVPRRKSVDFTVEVLPSRHAVLTRKPYKVIKTLSELRRETKVGTIPGTSWEEAALAAGVPKASLVPAADLKALLAMMKEGRVKSAVMSLSDMTLAIRRDPALQAGLFLGTPGHAAFAVRKADTDLRRALDEYLTDTKRSQSYSRLVVKYFGNDALKILGRARKQ